MQIENIAAQIKSLKTTPKPLLIAIEGYGGSGKSTLANDLSKLLASSVVISMDDFIVKDKVYENDWDKGSFDRLRLEEEVLIPIANNLPVSYRRLEWETNTLSEPIPVPTCDYIIVEGISSYHPSIANYYDVKVWVNTTIDTAKARGKQRDKGNENEQHWGTWSENDIAYQKKYHPEQLADFVIEN